jgi:hypothetical protein
MKQEQTIKDIQSEIFDLKHLPRDLQPNVIDPFSYPPETEWEVMCRELAGDKL